MIISNFENKQIIKYNLIMTESTLTILFNDFMYIKKCVQN